MNRILPWAGQFLLYGVFAAVIGVFSAWPAYQPLPPDRAVLKVSFIHHGQRVAECRALSPAELAKLAPNMRTAMKCERERSPVTIEVDLDGSHRVPAGRRAFRAVARRRVLRLSPARTARRRTPHRGAPEGPRDAGCLQSTRARRR